MDTTSSVAHDCIPTQLSLTTTYVTIRSLLPTSVRTDLDAGKYSVFSIVLRNPDSTNLIRIALAADGLLFYDIPAGSEREIPSIRAENLYIATSAGAITARALVFLR